LAEKQLDSGAAEEKLREIIKVQGGDPKIDSEEIKIGQEVYEVKAEKEGDVKLINDSHLYWLARILGAPSIKEAGLYLYKGAGDEVKKGEVLFALYANNKRRLKATRDSLDDNPIYYVS